MKIAIKITNQTFPLIALMLTCVVIGSIAGTPASKELKDYLINLPFAMPEISEPKFPANRVSIVEFGAVADGRTMNTKAFTDAIRACAIAGGGTVEVPPGTWLTGPIKFENNTK